MISDELGREFVYVLCVYAGLAGTAGLLLTVTPLVLDVKEYFRIRKIMRGDK